MLAACGGGASAGNDPAPAPGPSYSGTPGDYSKTVTVAGVSRNYLLHVPASYSSSAPMPAVILLHGGQGSAASIGNITGPGGFSGLADRSNFIAITPDSQAGTWDDGRETIPNRTNDVAFVAALLDAVALDYRLDKQRVYAAGISNGGMMALRLACDLSDRITAVAAVAANLPAALASSCNPTRPVPVVLFSGTADPLMPYGGGTVATSGSAGQGGAVLSVAATVSFWLNKNGNTAAPVATAVPNTDLLDGTTTDLLAYGSAGSTGQVVLYRINEGGHTWPGGTQYFPALLIGRVSKDFSANDAIWAFFASQPKR
jgi:polyhydroxybutyrate depolymerase